MQYYLQANSAKYTEEDLEKAFMAGFASIDNTDSFHQWLKQYKNENI